MVIPPPDCAPWIVDGHASDDTPFGGFNISGGEGSIRDIVTSSFSMMFI